MISLKFATGATEFVVSPSTKFIADTNEKVITIHKKNASMFFVLMLAILPRDFLLFRNSFIFNNNRANWLVECSFIQFC
jgi:hypothetical protein